MLEKHSLSSNENSDSQSRRTDNHLRQSTYQFTKNLLSHITCCVSPKDESQPHEQDSINVPDNPAQLSSHPFDLEKPLAKPSDKLLDIARGAVSKEWVHPDKAAEHLAETIKKASREGKKIGLMFDIDYTLLDPRNVKSGTNNWKMPPWWLEAVKKLQKHDIKIAINTGRSTQDIDQAFENAGAMELRNSLYLFGEDSNMYKKPGEDWKSIDPEAQIYVNPTKEIRNKIKNEIEKNGALTKLGINADKIMLDQTVGVTFPKWLV